MASATAARVRSERACRPSVLSISGSCIVIKSDNSIPVLVETMKASAPRPEVAGGFQHPAMKQGRKLNMTCGNCQLICHPEEDERKRRYKMLTKNGVVVQHADGTLQAVSPEIAKKHLAEMSEEQRAMYEEV